jgi:hypothetical protein
MREISEGKTTRIVEGIFVRHPGEKPEVYLAKLMDGG